MAVKLAVTLNEEHRVMLFENRVLSTIFWDWRRCYVEELHVACCTPDIIRVETFRKKRRAGYVAPMG